MKYYKDPETQAVYAYPADGTGDAFIKTGLQLITESEALAITNPPPSLEHIKDTARAQINRVRDRKEQGGFSYLDKVFDSDPVSAARIQNTSIVAERALKEGKEYPVYWTTADNSIILLDAEQAAGMIEALNEHGMSTHYMAAQLKSAIDECVSAEEVAAVLADEWLQ